MDNRYGTSWAHVCAVVSCLCMTTSLILATCNFGSFLIGFHFLSHFSKLVLSVFLEDVGMMTEQKLGQESNLVASFSDIHIMDSLFFSLIIWLQIFIANVLENLSLVSLISTVNLEIFLLNSLTELNEQKIYLKEWCKQVLAFKAFTYCS